MVLVFDVFFKPDSHRVELISHDWANKAVVFFIFRPFVISFAHFYKSINDNTGHDACCDQVDYETPREVEPEELIGCKDGAALVSDSEVHQGVVEVVLEAGGKLVTGRSESLEGVLDFFFEESKYNEPVHEDNGHHDGGEQPV